MPETPKTRPARRPDGLNLLGRRLWKAVASTYELRPDELVLLESACRTVDLIAELQAGMVGEPLMVKGSAGQMREHPLLSESRAQRALLKSLLVSLKLPDLNVGAGGASVNQHRDAALSRWAATHGSSSAR